MERRDSQGPTVTGRRVLVAAGISVCAAALSWVAVPLIVGSFRQAAWWVLPSVAIGTLAVVLVGALILLPSFTRRA